MTAATATHVQGPSLAQRIGRAARTLWIVAVTVPLTVMLGAWLGWQHAGALPTDAETLAIVEVLTMAFFLLTFNSLLAGTALISDLVATAGTDLFPLPWEYSATVLIRPLTLTGLLFLIIWLCRLASRGVSGSPRHP